MSVPCVCVCVCLSARLYFLLSKYDVLFTAIPPHISDLAVNVYQHSVVFKVPSANRTSRLDAHTHTRSHTRAHTLTRTHTRMHTHTHIRAEIDAHSPTRARARAWVVSAVLWQQ